MKRRQIVGAWQAIVQQAAGDELSRTWLIMAPLKQRLADALRAPAMDLPVHDHRIKDDANVIDGGKAFELDCARFLIDLDFDNAAAVGKAERCCCGVGSDEAARSVHRASSRKLAVRSVPTMKNFPSAIFDIWLGRLEPLRRELAPLFDQTLDSARDRCTADHQRA